VSVPGVPGAPQATAAEDAVVAAARPAAEIGLYGGRQDGARQDGARQHGARQHGARQHGARSNGARQGPAIACAGLSFRYPTSSVLALSDVSFTADFGAITGLIGPNGSGKSTLVDVLSGRSRPLSGEVRIDGQVLTNSGAAQRARHGLVRTFQTARLVEELTSRDNTRSGLYYRVPRIGLRAPAWPLLPSANRTLADMNRRAGLALSYVGARQWEDRQVSEISHGVEQLTQIALACVGEPSVVILDEPLAGLSVAEVERVREVLVQLRDAGVAVILIEHQVSFVFSVCDQITVLAAGELVTSGPAADVRANSRVREIYLGQR
jgi:branched-chain amino acid transport system permease protein